MNELGFYRFPAHQLDPSAQEFYQTTTLPSVPPQIYYPYPPPPPYVDIGYAQPQFFPPPVYVGAVAEPLPPPTPLVSLPMSSAPPSRTLLVSMVPTSVSESTVRRELEVFGDVRAVQMERRREGLVTVHFYDLRDAESALAAIKEQHMQQQYRLGRHYGAVLNYSMALAAAVPPPPLPPRTARGLISGRVVWAQFSTPVTSGLPDGNNQGTLVIFNLKPVVSTAYLRENFEAFGAVKELRETPNKRYQRFVEFYDVRDASRAMSEMNGGDIYGQTIVIEYSRPGGNFWKKLPKVSNKFMTSRNYWRPLKKPASSNDECSAGRKNGGGGCGGGSWKQRGGGRWGKDPRFLINEDATVEVSNRRDPRTTVMIKNIPNKYSQKLLLNMLDNHCIHSNEQIGDGEEDQPLSSYDFVYLPIDFINKCNVGYGFVNMTSPEATLRLYKAFHHQNWQVFNSRKVCQVTYARLQGLEALREHFKNSKFPIEAEDYMPVVFSPARDGRVLPEPVPITDRLEGSPSSARDYYSDAGGSGNDDDDDNDE